ncbi:MAG TPA: SseB family protein [Moraxellaceae bacterium]
MSAPDLAQPLNDIETLLLAVRQGQAGIADLLDTLVDTEVFILLDREPGPDDLLEGRALPLLLSNPQGLPLLAVFTAAERSVPMAVEFPRFGVGMAVVFRELLTVVRPGVGLVMNPGTTLGFEMPAANVAHLRTVLLTD